MTNKDFMLLQISGYLHILLCIGSLSLPFILNWREEFAHNKKIIKQMFVTYSIYILGVNLFFGMVSVIATKELLSNSILAKSLLLFISLYWGLRLCIQFFYFDESLFKGKIIYAFLELIMIAMFLFFTIIYGYLYLT